MNEELKNLEGLFQGLNETKPENLKGLVDESIKVFEKILTKLNSTDEKEQQEAYALAEELRNSLEVHAKEALEKINIDEKQLESFLGNSQNFSEEEWKSLQEAKSSIDAYRSDLVAQGILKTPESNPEKKSKKKPPQWIPS